MLRLLVGILGPSVFARGATIGNATAMRQRHQRRANANQAYPDGLSAVFEADLEVAFGRSQSPDDARKDDDASCKGFAKTKCDALTGTLRVFGVGCAAHARESADCAATARWSATARRRIPKPRSHRLRP